MFRRCTPANLTPLLDTSPELKTTIGGSRTDICSMRAARAAHDLQAAGVDRSRVRPPAGLERHEAEALGVTLRGAQKSRGRLGIARDHRAQPLSRLAFKPASQAAPQPSVLRGRFPRFGSPCYNVNITRVRRAAPWGLAGPACPTLP